MNMKKDSSLKQVLEIGKECKRCNHCCSFGSGFLVGDDKKKIAKHLGLTEKKLEEKYLEEVEKFNTKLFRPKTIKKPYGKCVFLDDKKGCTIHKVKPLQCRVGNCGPYGEELSLWFTLNYFVNKDNAQSIRDFATYLKSGGKTLPKGELKDFVSDKNKLKKILNYDILK